MDRRLLLVLSFGNFVMGVGAFVIIGILSPIASAFAISKAEAGLFLTAYAVTYAVASPVLTAFAGKVDRRTLLIGSMAVFVLAAVLSAIAWNVPSLGLARVLAAVGGGLFTPTSAAVAVATTNPESRPAALARVFFGLTLAQIVGVPVGGYLGYALDWHVAFWVVVGIGVVALGLLARLVPAGLPFQPTSLAMLGKVLTTPRQIVAVLFTVAFLGAVYCVYTYIGPLGEERLGLGGTGVTMLLVAFGLGAVTGNAFGAALTRKFGAEKVLLGLCLAQALYLPAMSTLDAGLAPLLLLAFLWSAFGWAFMVPQQLRLIALAPEAQSVILALNAASIYVAASFGSALGGVAFSRLGLSSTGFVGALVALAGAALLTLPRRLR